MDDFQLQFDAAIQKYASENQYEVSMIPAHSHNGTDSLPIAFESLTNSSTYVALQPFVLFPGQIKSLFTAPITLVPKFGVNTSNIGINYVFIVEGITARMYAGVTPYTGANNLEFRYTNASGAKVTADLPAAFINSTVNLYGHAPAVTAEFTPVYNSSIVVTVPTANPGAGDGKILGLIKYRIVYI